MIAFPNAKINIGLRVLDKRADGYHDLETIFYPVRVYDALEIVPSDKTDMFLSGLPLTKGENLCTRAYDMLARDFQIEPMHIFLHKHIPIGAGLGGGSADAAFLLKLLDAYFNLQLSMPKLEHYAAQLGADCAFFIRNEPAFAQGKGDRLSPFELDLSAYTIVLVCPDVFISTAEAFKEVTPKRMSETLVNKIDLPIAEWKAYLTNDFEPGIFKRYPALERIKNRLYASGALYASMSGSGSSIFGIFEKGTPVPNFKNKHYRIFID